MSAPAQDQNRIDAINKNLKAAYQKEEAYWKQRSRTLWLSLRDKNSGSVHQRSSSCRETVSQAINPCISPETNDALIAAPTTEEIRLALFFIHPDKVSGPDGFSASFFSKQTDWNGNSLQRFGKEWDFMASGSIGSSNVSQLSPTLFWVNGAAHGLVIPQRGIRQGDPLSPFIFILCGEVLSSLCKNAQANGSLAGIRVARGSVMYLHFT
ncbi:unnamed protein product [Microthlaspi erraticum]|uniref:Reverse transcriptase domain-containing protein n=1 Tax=Microthlaspi erraticum TaxID=1685480 RepID=A0A6D2K622_9BRAS|nr:unnamed protein product [Microthlaspi erraticum]